MGDQWAQEDDLHEIIMTHYDIGDLDEEEFQIFCHKTIHEMVKTLMSGGKWKEWTLSEFLKEHAFSERGEVLRTSE